MIEKPEVDVIIQPEDLEAWLEANGHTVHPCQHPDCITGGLLGPRAHITVR
jgi:hypothetical protein